LGNKEQGRRSAAEKPIALDPTRQAPAGNARIVYTLIEVHSEVAQQR
jgi:hypothetical protein